MKHLPQPSLQQSCALLILAPALALAACNPTPENSATVSTETPTITTTATTHPNTPPTSTTTATASTGDGTALLGRPAKTPVRNIETTASQLVVKEVRVGEHPNFDRVVFEIQGEEHPGWLVEATTEPRQQASGYPVEFTGDSALVVLLYGLDNAPHPDEIPLGPVAKGKGAITGVSAEGIFEAVGQFVIGIQGTTEPEFSVTLLENPTRVVIDVAKNS